MLSGIMIKFLLFIFFVTSSFASRDLNLKNYLKAPEFRQVRMSPDGVHIVFVSVKENITKISVLKRNGLKPITSYQLDPYIKVNQIFWLNKKRIMINAMYEEGYLKADSIFRNYIMAMDLDGSNRRILFPKKSKSPSIKMTNNQFSFTSKEIIDDKYILIIQYTADQMEFTQKLSKLNIYTGDIKYVDSIKMERGSYVLDNLNRARIAYKVNDNLEAETYIKNLKNGDWIKKEIWPVRTRALSFIGFNKDNTKLYVLGDYRKSMRGLFEITISEEAKVGKLKEIFSYEKGDILNVEWDKSQKEPSYLDYGQGMPQRKYLNNSKFTETIKALGPAFPGEVIYPINQVDGTYLLYVRSDIRPGAYYIFDEKKSSVNELLSTNGALRGFNSISSQLIETKSRDKLNLYAYFYEAKTKGKSPMIVNIHGGPIGVTESWGFDGDTQYLVSKGFSVLKVNFRGSGSLGLNFEKKGLEALGTGMINDIADVVDHVVKIKNVDPKKVCVWGISYGAYASVMSLARYPKKYQCGVAFGGLYDLNTFMAGSDVSKSYYGTNYWKEILPKTKEERKTQSPSDLSKNIVGELLLMHGAKDKRCNVEQSQNLYKKMKKEKKKIKYIEYEDTGHWFTVQNDKEKAFDEIISFMKKKLY